MQKGGLDTQDRFLDEQALPIEELHSTSEVRRPFMPATQDSRSGNVNATAGIGRMPQIQQAYENPRQGDRAIVAPAQRDVLNHANFGLLPQEKGRLGSFGVSAGVNLAIIAVILVLTITQVHEAKVRRQETLVYVAPPPKPYIPPVPKIKMPPIPPLPKPEVKIVPPKPVIEPPKVEPIKVATKVPVMPAPAPRPVVTPPKPVVGQFAAAQAPAQQAVRPAQAQTAGFGSPTGVQANPNASRPTALAVVGGFGTAASSNTGGAGRQSTISTTGFGAGTTGGSPNGSARGAVASTGFGSGSQAAGAPGGHGAVASTGFGAGQPAAGPAARVQQPVTTPIVVLAKPQPQYTAEAREAHVEGDVTLEVRFTADGQVEVLRVVNGLGHGLDEQARLAATRIRFKPSTRDGKPVDQVSVIHITFQLA